MGQSQEYFALPQEPPVRQRWPVGDTPDLKQWVLKLVRDRYDDVIGRLSVRIGMSQGAFSRGLDRGTLKTENLLRLAQETGTNASDVLRRAGKGDVVDLIEACYGAPRPMNPSVRRVVDELSDLPEPLVALSADWIQQWKAAGMSRESSAAQGLEKRPAATGKRSKRGNRRARAARGKNDEAGGTP